MRLELHAIVSLTHNHGPRTSHNYYFSAVFSVRTTCSYSFNHNNAFSATHIYDFYQCMCFKLYVITSIGQTVYLKVILTCLQVHMFRTFRHNYVVENSHNDDCEPFFVF